MIDFNHAIRNNPTNSLPYFNRSIAAYSKKDLADALDDLDTVIDLEPKHSRALSKRGNIRRVNHDLVGAIMDLNRALTINPYDSSALTGRADIKQINNDLVGAMNDLNKALAHKPKYGSAFFCRALVKFKKNDLDGALDDLDKALIYKFKTIYVVFALREYLVRNLEAAMANIKKARELNPRSNGIQNLYNLIQNEMTNHSSNNHNPIDFMSAAGFFAKQGASLIDRAPNQNMVDEERSTNPKEDLNKALHSDPKIANALFFRGKLKRKRGDLDAALDLSKRGNIKRENYGKRPRTEEHTRSLTQFDAKTSVVFIA